MCLSNRFSWTRVSTKCVHNSVLRLFYFEIIFRRIVCVLYVAPGLVVVWGFGYLGVFCILGCFGTFGHLRLFVYTDQCVFHVGMPVFRMATNDLYIPGNWCLCVWLENMGMNVWMGCVEQCVLFGESERMWELRWTRASNR